MALDANTLEQIRANAALAVNELGAASGLANFGYNRESVAWMDIFIERQRARLKGDPPGTLASVLGCYLGEAIIAATGGKWDRNDKNGLGVRLDGDKWCFPLVKVEKQFASGNQDGDSIFGFYNAAIAIARQDPKKRS